MTCTLYIIIIAFCADIQEELLSEVHLDRLVKFIVRCTSYMQLKPPLSLELTPEELKQEEKQESAEERVM